MQARCRTRVVFTPEQPELNTPHVVSGRVRVRLREVARLTKAQRLELDRRIRAHNSNKKQSRPAEEVIADIRKSLDLREK